jgi:hypothetical protein
MTEILHEIEHAVKVHIVGDDTKKEHYPTKPRQPKEIRATFHNYLVSNSVDPVMILGHAPNRIQAIIQIVSAGPVDLAASRADVERSDSTNAHLASGATGYIRLYTTGEVWANSTQAGVSTISVIAEYEEK